MGKTTGFLEYKRQELAARPPATRVKDWKEIKNSSINHKDSIKEQAARCMDCSIPFCHSGIMLGRSLAGCPLHNLMPEFNDFVYQDLDEFAYARLSQTNNFPEFTSHVCPAPCEGACSIGLIKEPVTIKNIEQYIIEQAFSHKLVQPNIPPVRLEQSVAVIGSGPSGLACADELNKAGYNVTVFERADRPGGLLMYGIPNMKLDKKLVERRVKLLEEAGVKFTLNSEIGVNIASDTLLKEFAAIVLCTGSPVPRNLPIKGRELKGIYYAKDYLQCATQTLLGDKADNNPLLNAHGKDVVVIGGGDTGTDCVATALRQGCKSIRQIEIMPCLSHTRTATNPWPEFPRIFKTDYGQEEAIALFKKDPRGYCITSKEFIGSDGCVDKLRICQVAWKEHNGNIVPNDIKGTEETIPAQLVLLAMGFTGGEEKLFNEFKIDKTPQNNIAANETDYATSSDKIFACGDARRGQSLVVWAIAEGRRCAAAVDTYLNNA